MARTQRIEGELTLGANQYQFYLHYRTVNLGSDPAVDYYYMPAGELRSSDPKAKRSNFRSCIGLWQAVSFEHGDRDDPVQQEHYAAALSYALFNSDKGQQEVYRDARLRAGAIRPGEQGVAEEVAVRIRRAVASRDWTLVRAELNGAFDAIDLSREDAVGIAAAVAEWRSWGAAFWRADGQEGLDLWLKLLDYWTSKYRKRSPERVRKFINYFAYHAKICFYSCYATFWSYLIPWLEEHHSLDRLSARLLRLWNWQPQPQAIAHGRTQQGIYYPVGGSAELRLPLAVGGVARLSWQSPHVGPQFASDVFGGQVLALHPIGDLILDDRGLASVVGRCLNSERFDADMAAGNTSDFAEYWDMVGAIMSAAYIYRDVRGRFESARGAATVAGEHLGQEDDANDGMLSPETMLAEFLETSPHHCQCGGSLAMKQGGALTPSYDGEIVLLSVQCSNCLAESNVQVHRNELEQFLTGGAEDELN